MERLIAAGDQTVEFLRGELPGLIKEQRPVFDTEPAPPAYLRLVRALEVLEFIGTPAAYRLVEEFARHNESTIVVREARAALARMTKQRKVR